MAGIDTDMLPKLKPLASADSEASPVVAASRRPLVKRDTILLPTSENTWPSNPLRSSASASSPTISDDSTLATCA